MIKVKVLHVVLVPKLTITKKGVSTRYYNVKNV
jgi:hypothetical protein